MDSSQLDGSFHPDAFVDVGNFLNSQGPLGREMRITAENASQTLATTTANASTLAAAPPATPPAPPANRRIMFGLLAFVVMLLGTNVYSYQQNRAWQAENSTLRAKIIKLESVPTGGSPDAFSTPPSCPGSQLIDTCWLKIGLGDCTKDVMQDSVNTLEDAVRFAWDSTAEVVGAVTDTVASDLRQVCDAMQSFGRFLFEL